MSLIQLLNLGEMKFFKVPHFEKPCFQTGMRVTISSDHCRHQRLVKRDVLLIQFPVDIHTFPLF